MRPNKERCKYIAAISTLVARSLARVGVDQTNTRLGNNCAKRILASRVIALSGQQLGWERSIPDGSPFFCSFLLEVASSKGCVGKQI